MPKNTKPQTYLEKLKEIKAQYVALEYKLDKLIEAETGKPESPLNELITIQQGAALMNACTKTFQRFVKEHRLKRYALGNRAMYRKIDVIQAMEYPKFSIFDPKCGLNI